MEPPADRMGAPTGGLIARGRAADVYADGAGRVRRRYRTPAQSAEPEAELMRYLHGQGYPVPEVFDAEGADLVMARVPGPTMLAELGRRPWTTRLQARLLAGLHEGLHAVPPPPGMRRPWDGDQAATERSEAARAAGSGRTERSEAARAAGSGKIERSEAARAAGSGKIERSEAARAAGSGNHGSSIVHLDLHPDNVILAPAGPVVIDWSNAVVGPPGIDLARTWVMVAAMGGPSAAWQRPIESRVRRSFVKQFLAYADQGAARRWFDAAVEVTLLDPHVTATEAAAIRELQRRTSPVP